MSTAQIAELGTAVAPHLYWIASRAAGVAALVLSSLAVCVGLSMSARLLRGRGAELRVMHEALSLATLVALVVHGLSLLGDGYLHPSLGDLAIPLLSGYETVWTSIGIVAFWMLLALGLSYYARRRIGVQRWRALHRFAALAWMLGVAHSLGEGTDAGQAWFLAVNALAVLPALALLAYRWWRAWATPAEPARGPSVAAQELPRSSPAKANTRAQGLVTGNPTTSIGDTR
jgi:methionine sulfoxide reductase heme-binding subunit